MELGQYNNSAELGQYYKSAAVLFTFERKSLSVELSWFLTRIKWTLIILLWKRRFLSLSPDCTPSSSG